ncbi:MAG TPA: hypothetical protein VFP72_04490 [Kineosporiaceae bacterium]|nr:hypothetical protein [Kineosporiaceae bacterium]
MVERGRACVIHLAWGGPDGALAELPRINCWTLAVRHEAACREWIMLEEGG